MHLTPGTLIDGRYQLVERIGDGAMGQVWRASDTRFESRTVAVKFLREDQTLGDDAERRHRLIARLKALATAHPLDLSASVDALASALGGRDLSTLKERVGARLGGAAPTPELIATLFDEFVNDPTLNENARLRAKMRRLFRDEANSVANLRHDNIVSIFDYGEFEATPYLVMDYIDGRTLHQILEQRLTLSLTRKLQLIEDLCAGLSFAHSRQLVHRDIKPANLIIDQTTGGLKVLDFGVVRKLGSESTVGIPIGTFCYMSPEQTQGAPNLDQRSDIFAVGLVFYELITGNKAFPAGKNVGDLVMRIQRESPPAIKSVTPGVPDRVQQIIDKAIAKRPEDRYQDLRDMQRDVARVRVEQESSERGEATMVMKVADLGATIIAKPNAGDAPVRPSLKVPTFADARSSQAEAVPPAATVIPVVTPPPLPASGSPAAAVPRATAAAVPASNLRAGVSWKVPAAAAAALVLLVIAAMFAWQRMTAPVEETQNAPPAAIPASEPPPPPVPQATSAPVDTSAPAMMEGAAEATSPVGLNSVTIDIRPWARVRVVPVAAEGQAPPSVPAEALYAPFTVDLAPGDYTLEAENGGLNRNATFPIKVELGKPQVIVRIMPGFNATKTVDALLAQD